MASPRQIHLVRHAQGLHNVSAANHVLVDPALTAYGRRQCSALAKQFSDLQNNHIVLLAASPLRRTLDTARLGFPQYPAKIIALPDAQEVGDLPCDTGSPLAQLTAEFSAGVDLSLVSHDWQLKTGRYRRNTEALAERAKDVRMWLREKCIELDGEGDVVLVTHGGFLHFLTEDWTDYDPLAGTGWTNTEFRTYEFLDPADPTAPMTETEKSRNRRKGSPRPNRTEFIKMHQNAFSKQSQISVKSSV